jgi:NAD(P)-dependent dehydrogenase (short-subunit alcohol dehydrogenase family)
MELGAGKVAVVTGAGSGIGFALANALASAGCSIVLADVQDDALERATAAIGELGVETLAVRTDVSKEEQVAALAQATLVRFGAVHVVCNNAGVAGGTVIDTPIEMWEWVLGVNLRGVVNGCVTFLPGLLAQDEGHVVNTASLAGLAGIAGLGVYCTTKFAVVGLSESLFHELADRGSNVHVSVICPGFVQTRIGDSHRNMPADVRRALDVPSPADGSDSGAVPSAGDVVGLGVPATAVGDEVFTAVREERFWVLPHPRAARAATGDRLAWMTDGSPAVVDLMAAIEP